MRKPDHADYTDFATLAVVVPVLIAEAAVMAGLFIAVLIGVFK